MQSGIERVNGPECKVFCKLDKISQGKAWKVIKDPEAKVIAETLNSEKRGVADLSDPAFSECRILSKTKWNILRFRPSYP